VQSITRCYDCVYNNSNSVITVWLWLYIRIYSVYKTQVSLYASYNQKERQ